MKKICTLAFLLALVLSLMAVPAYASGNASIQVVATPSVPTVDITSGDATFDVTFTVKAGSTVVGALDFRVGLPQGCTVTGRPSSPNGSGTFNAANLAFTWYDTYGYDGDFEVLKITVTVSKANAKLVENGAIELNVTNIANIDGQKLTSVCTSVPGSISIIHTVHDWGDWKTDGTNHWKECQTDGCNAKDSYGAHSYGPWTPGTEPTCKDPGSHSHTCTVCGKEVTEEIPADSSKHVPDAEWHSDDPAGHYHVCTVCHQKIELTAHTLKAEDKGNGYHASTCTECDYAETEVAHSSKNPYVTDGTNHWKVCDACGAKFDEAPHAAAAGAAWEKDSKEHYHYCETCKAKIDVAEHTPGSDLVEIKPATCTEPGLGNFTCKDCGQELSSAPIPATGHKKPDDPSQIQEVEPTCEEDGYIKYQCQNADHEVVEPSGKTALGHDMPEEWTVIKDATYLEKGEESRKCSRYDQCKHEEKQDIDVLPLDSDHLTVKPIVRGLDESVGAGVKAQIENFVKDYAKTGKHGPEVSDKFADAVMAALEGSEPIEIEVTVALDDVAANKLPASFNDAPGALLDSKQLTITAKVNGTAVDGDILSALPAPAAFSINKKYPNLIGLLNYGDEKGYSGLEFTKDGDVTTASALEVGYYALYTTSDLRWAEIFFDQTNVFNGSAVEPKVRIVVNGEELDPSYYTISYKNNTKVGTGEFSIELTAEGEAAGFTLAEPIVNDFEITAAPATPTPKPAEKDKSQSDVPATGDETNVVLYAAVMVLCTAALALVLLRKKSSR